MNQESLEVQIPYTYTIRPDHIVRIISDFVDSLPLDMLLKNTPHTGRRAFHPAMLLKMTLYAYSQGQTSGRKIQAMNEDNLPMKWLTQDTSISYRTINRFRVASSTQGLIKQMYLSFYAQLKEQDLVSDEAIFVDGTKIKADANKYSFVWRKATEKNEAKLDQKTSDLYDEMIQAGVDTSIEAEEGLSPQQLQQLATDLDHQISDLDEEVSQEKTPQPGGSPSKRRRRKLKKYRHKITTDFLPRKQKYTIYNATFQGRNSFSKTDLDATFMRMKEDSMRNGQLKPGYNLQIATNNQYVLNYQVFPNPTDTRTFIPFLKSTAILNDFSYVVADAGYGSESNYGALIDDLEKTPLIPYGMMLKEEKKKFKNDPTKSANWDYNAADDFYVDYQGVYFSFKNYSIRHDKYGFERKFKIYEADRNQPTAELDQLAKTPKGRQRKIYYNPAWEYFKNYTKEKLSDPELKNIYGQRKIDVESVFGNLKGNFAFHRVHVRGKEAVSNELGLMLMALNLTKMVKFNQLNSPFGTKKKSCQRNNTKFSQIQKISCYFYPNCERFVPVPKSLVPLKKTPRRFNFLESFGGSIKSII